MERLNIDYKDLYDMKFLDNEDIHALYNGAPKSCNE
jgi:hypothetical protein